MTADERINSLLERAGCPVMVVKNEENHTHHPMPAYRTIGEALSAYLEENVRGLVDTIDRLEVALENVLNERDALAADFKLYRERNIKCVSGVYACDLCIHGGDPYDPAFEGKKCPKGCDGVKHWKWRGVPDKEG